MRDRILEIDWTTGPNVTGFYSGTKQCFVPDDADEDEIIDIALRRVARDMCWNGKLQIKEIRRVG